MISLIVGAIAIGSSPIFVRLSELGPVATAFWRLSLAMPVLWLWAGLGERGTNAPRRPSGYADFLALAFAGLCFTGDITLWHLSVVLTSVANSTLLVNLAPVFVALGSWLIFGERFSTTFLLGMVVAIAGSALLVGRDLALDTQNLSGDALALLAAAFYGGYILTVSRLRSRFSTPTIMVSSGAVTCVALLPITLLSRENLLATTVYGWAVLLGVALISHAGGQSLVTYALSSLPAAFSSVGLLLQPVAAATLAWALLGEALGIWQILGGVVVLFGIVLTHRGIGGGRTREEHLPVTERRPVDDGN
ncbi:MAG: DMT family transporter [Rubrobacter sp.]|nr:DMT family transporter [Rubrobacter sp.]